MLNNNPMPQQIHVQKSLGHTLIGGLKEKLKQYTQHFSTPKRMKVVEAIMDDMASNRHNVCLEVIEKQNISMPL
jgi:hypothetical protein